MQNRRWMRSTALLTVYSLLSATIAPTSHGQRMPRGGADGDGQGSSEGDASETGGGGRGPAGGVGRRTGFELALHGALVGRPGRAMVLRGTAYEVIGLATLRALPRAVVRIFERDAQGHREEQALGEVTTEEGGRFAVSVSPRTRGIDVVVREGQGERSWSFDVQMQPEARYELFTDRILYEPGEAIQGWLRALDATSAATLSGRTIEWSIGGEGGVARLGQARTRTSDAGVGTVRVEIPASAPDGTVPIVAMVDGVRTVTSVRIGRRTVERLMALVTIDRRVVSPGAAVTGRVQVSTPSGTPVAFASIELSTGIRGATPMQMQTDRDGVATFSLNAPAFTEQEVSVVSVFVRVRHAAYGAITASESFTVARVPYQVEVVAATGAIAPEVTGTVYLTLTTPAGRPAPAGTPVTITGPALRGGRARGTTDRHGIVVFETRLPRNAATFHGSGKCADHRATSLGVVVEGQVPLDTTACVPVATGATVVPRVLQPTVTAGGRIEVALERASFARGRSVAVDLLHAAPRASRTMIASAVAGPSEGRVSVTLPREYVGPLWVRARPIGAEGSDEGVGAIDAVLVRPAQVFSLSMTADRPMFHVRETARLTLRSPEGLEGAHVALLTRDLAAHGGERNFALSWLGGAVDAAVADPSTPDADRLVRSALAAMVTMDARPAIAEPLVAPRGPQEEERSQDGQREGDLRDPYVLRDELVRRGIADVMRALESAVESSLENPEARDVVAAGRRGFAPTAVHALIARGELERDTASTLGGDEMTVAMLEATDPSFSFERVARRVARKRLVSLLATLGRFAEQSPAARTEPIERWLSRIGGADPSVLRDPWGGTFTLRRVEPGREPVAVHARLSGWELLSPGPDRVAGTADDVRDPFARGVPEGTPYAIASGEDSLMASLASIDVGGSVLSRIMQAYDRIADAAEEERVGDSASASRSLMRVQTIEIGGEGDEAQAYGAADTDLAERFAAAAARRNSAALAREASGGLGASGSGLGGGGGGYGRGYGSGSSRSGSSVYTTGGAAPAFVRVGPRSAESAAMVRERFPATLQFLAERPLDRSGQTTVEVPLADALTTYRVEAIAWTREGWTTSSSMELRVDQDAVVDAPVPPFAAAGDELRLPIRLQNRSLNTLRAQVSVRAEGGVELAAAAQIPLDVPAGEAREVVLPVRLLRAGEGALVVSATDRVSGAALDAARRSITVLAPARPVRASVESLIDAASEFSLEVPADGVFRDRGVLRLVRSESLFGDPRAWASDDDMNLWAAWALAMQGQPSSPGSWGARFVPNDVGLRARGIAARWMSAEIPDALLREWLERFGPEQEFMEQRAMDRGTGAERRSLAWIETSIQTLIGLAPAVMHRARRAALAPLLDRVVQRARRRVESEVATATDPALFARAAAALALTGPRGEGRAREFLRRAGRGEPGGFDAIASEGASASGFSSVDPRDRGEQAEALAAYGIALLLDGDRAAAFRIMTALARRSANARGWPASARALATALAAKITTALPTGAGATATVTVDGQRFELPVVQGVAVLLSRALSTPGVHRVRVEVPAGTVVLAQAEARYGRPWGASTSSRGALSMAIEGAQGVRDTQAGFVLRVQNRSAIMLARPWIEVDLPSGAELDQPARDALSRRLAGPPVITGRTLALRLRPLTPGGVARIALPLRWSVGGTLAGLGVAGYSGPEINAPVTVLAPRVLTVADEGSAPSSSDGGREGARGQGGSVAASIPEVR
jgi:hypothetical protein